MTPALVLEDDRNTLNALATLVELEGFEVRTAQTLAEAREVLSSFQPKVILSDLMLPDGRGTRYLRAGSRRRRVHRAHFDHRRSLAGHRGRSAEARGL